MPGRLGDYLSRLDAQLSAWDTAVTENVLFAVGRGASLAAACEAAAETAARAVSILGGRPESEGGP